MSQLKGIDISHWQTVNDWNALSKVIDFIYLKSTEDSLYTDSKLIDNYNAAKSVGLLVGFYHYARPNSADDGLKEADFFISKVGSLKADLPHVLDIETNTGGLSTADIDRFCINWAERVHSVTKNSVWIYSYYSFIKNNLGKELNAYPLWYANYTAQGNVGDGKVWSSIIARQYSETGKVAGISDNVDMDIILDDSFLHPSIPPYVPVSHGVVMKVKAVGGNDIRTAPDHRAGFVRNTEDGELFDVYVNVNDWHNVGGASWIDGNNGQNLSWLREYVYVTAQPGDYVSKWAKAYGSTLADIKAWNGLDDKYTILAGYSYRVK